MMLPEHVSMLPESESTHNRMKRPVLDMAQVEDMEKVISEAMEFNNPVQFSVFKPLPMLNGPETGEIVQIEGYIHYIISCELLQVVD
ncbi:YolD-like family protein [Bacillus sp. BS3(2021)]|uniref:YolD-like family protein n=1 Tax=Bacillus TaxID=1386 RepID=UPI001E421D4F|nr:MULTISPECIES: YolD-like family protein [Bacillus]MCD2370827.1 YolD-like family protein [Bacillus sp. BS3(2021)]MCJ8232220.1 YolD-like family protein [Bacillus paralicheniformis]